MQHLGVNSPQKAEQNTKRIILSSTKEGSFARRAIEIEAVDESMGANKGVGAKRVDKVDSQEFLKSEGKHGADEGSGADNNAEGLGAASLIFCCK